MILSDITYQHIYSVYYIKIKNYDLAIDSSSNTVQYGKNFTLLLLSASFLGKNEPLYNNFKVVLQKLMCQI